MDHKDGNKQNNCSSNLRGCNQRENLQNRPKRFGSVSRFKGVFYDQRTGKWYAQISIANVPFWLGTFTDEVEAARAYDRVAIECFGEFAYLNFPEDWPLEKRQEAYAKKEMVKALRKKRAQRAKNAEANTRQGKSKKGKGKRTKQEQKDKSKKGRGRTRRK